MFGTFRLATAATIGLALASHQAPLAADQVIRCESSNYQYNMCRVDTHGFVRLQRQISRTDCRQGRNWDYDRRGIWVDDGCAAEFLVESRHHTEHHDDHNGEKAVAAVAAIALIAAAASAANSNKHEDRYHDNEYHHGGHSSYLPGWMIGQFKGYNTKFGATVRANISNDGRARLQVENTRLEGYVNDGRLYVGDAEFYIERAGDGFNTVQAGDRSNVVHYERER
jgi:hypothetical protein